MKQMLCGWLCLGLLGLAAACRPAAQYYTTSGQMHTYYRITYRHTEPLDKDIEARIADFYRALNPFDSLSIVSAVNRNEDVELDSLFVRAFGVAQEVAARTDGMFDITCAPLINAWGFGFARMDSVGPALIDSLKSFVDYRKVRIEGGRLVKDDPRIQLNLSAVGDGFICDLIAEMLEQRGVQDFLVDIGGEMVAKGTNPQGRHWRIGINKPVDDSTQLNTDIQQVVQLSGRVGLATSGNYRNFYVKDGRKYAHTIDPRTGYPAEADILSATVLAPTCTVADGYATSCMVLGRARARALLSRQRGLEYFFIYADSTGRFCTEYSEGMKKYLVETN